MTWSRERGQESAGCFVGVHFTSTVQSDFCSSFLTFCSRLASFVAADGDVLFGLLLMKDAITQLWNNHVSLRAACVSMTNNTFIVKFVCNLFAIWMNSSKH